MAIVFEKFLEWAENHFDDIQISGNEIKMPSPFKQGDLGHKLWCNPSGGKINAPYGVYRCWSSPESNPDARGSLPKLIMLIDGVSFQEALCTLGVIDDEYVTDEQLLELESIFDPKIELKQEIEESLKLNLPTSTFLITDLPNGNYFRCKAEKYLNKRKISIQGLYVCTGAKYRGRIVLPYYDKEGNLIYYNCRAMEGEIPKYLGPPKEEVKIGKSNVIFIPKYPPKNEKIYITEGEIDALSILQCGLYAGALGGKNLSEYQFNVLKNYIPVLAFDNDEGKSENYGEMATMIIGESLLKKGLEVFYTRPPDGFKDWNELLEKYNFEIVKGCIEKSEKPFTENTIIELLEKNL